MTATTTAPRQITYPQNMDPTSRDLVSQFEARALAVPSEVRESMQRAAYIEQSQRRIRDEGAASVITGDDLIASDARARIDAHLRTKAAGEFAAYGVGSILESAKNSIGSTIRENLDAFLAELTRYYQQHRGEFLIGPRRPSEQRDGFLRMHDLVMRIGGGEFPSVEYWEDFTRFEWTPAQNHERSWSYRPGADVMKTGESIDGHAERAGVTLKLARSYTEVNQRIRFAESENRGNVGERRN